MNLNSFPILYHIISIIKTSLKSYENDIDGDDTNVKRKKSMECTKNKGIVDRGKMKSWDENSMQMQCNSMLICRETKGLVGFSFGDSENVFTSGWLPDSECWTYVFVTLSVFSCKPLWFYIFVCKPLNDVVIVKYPLFFVRMLENTPLPRSNFSKDNYGI